MTDAVTKLNRIRDAIAETILEMTSEELRQSFIDDGEDPDKVADEVREIIATAIASRQLRGWPTAISNVEVWPDGVRFTETAKTGEAVTVYDLTLACCGDGHCFCAPAATPDKDQG